MCLYTDGLEDARREGTRLGRESVARLLAAREVPDATLLLGDLAEVADRISDDTAFMLLCTVLVLLMTIPGLALFYSGMIRKKNILATMAQSFVLAALITVVWVVAGYSLAFGNGNGGCVLHNSAP